MLSISGNQNAIGKQKQRTEVANLLIVQQLVMNRNEWKNSSQVRCGSEVIWVASSYFELYGVVGYRGTWAGAAPRSRIGRPLGGAVRYSDQARPPLDR